MGVPIWGFYRTGGIVKIRLDVIPPTIYLIGSSTISIRVGDPYIDLGVTALDDDNTNVIPYLISLKNSNQNEYLTTIIAISNNTNISTNTPLTIDTYILTYTATDIIGNITTAYRTLTVTA
jgi:hypothetical protein